MVLLDIPTGSFVLSGLIWLLAFGLAVAAGSVALFLIVKAVKKNKNP